MNEHELNWILEKAGVPKRFRSARRKDIDEKTWKRTEPFLSGQSLYLWGPTGSGKTHLASALVREAVQANPKLRPRFAHVPTMLLQIRYAMFEPPAGSITDDTRTERAVTERYSKADLLVLDDIGLEKITDWAFQILAVILDERYAQMRQTLVTSNYSLGELSARIGDRNASRLSGMGVIAKLDGADRRLRTERA